MMLNQSEVSTEYNHAPRIESMLVMSRTCLANDYGHDAGLAAAMGDPSGQIYISCQEPDEAGVFQVQASDKDMDTLQYQWSIPSCGDCGEMTGATTDTLIWNHPAPDEFPGISEDQRESDPQNFTIYCTVCHGSIPTQQRIGSALADR